MLRYYKRICRSHSLAQGGSLSYDTPSLQHPIESSHIEENRLIASLQPNVETVNGLTIPLAALRD